LSLWVSEDEKSIRTLIILKFLSVPMATVVAGSPLINPPATDKDVQKVSSTQIFYHPEYTQNTKENDIAIIRVSPPLNTTG
jgi:hypothetical protein